MPIYGNNFFAVRNRYVLPSIVYGIKKNKSSYWSLKDIITSRVISINKLSGKAFEIELKKEDYYKALHCDIELFMNKSMVQYSDFIKSKENSPCWSFVTLYYLTFFSTTCLFRFLNRGFIFLSTEQKKRLELFFQAVHSEVVAIDSGNYYFHYKEENAEGNVIITLSFKGDNVHKLNWLQLESTFREFLPNCDNDEKIVLDLFLLHFSKFRQEFPSNLRNKLNYNGESSILDIEDVVAYIDLEAINNNFLKGLSAIETSINLPNQINSIGHLANYLIKFNNALYKEYLDRSIFGKDFDKARVNYMTKNNVSALK
jgi:hypothetical protein